jgi:hypothetical protein
MGMKRNGEKRCSGLHALQCNEAEEMARPMWMVYELVHKPRRGIDTSKESVPQGLKPDTFSTVYGTAEAVPFQNSPVDSSSWTRSMEIP